MIKIGDSLPALPLRILKNSIIEEVMLKDQIKGKKVILFAVPGAFTPTCSQQHLPSFIHQADAIKAHGIDEIYCVAVNDPYVLDIWRRVPHAEGKITLLSDGNGAFTKQMGLLLEGNPVLGLRSKRYVAILDNGILIYLAVEPHPTDCSITCAENFLKILDENTHSK